ncbi:MAG: hypothetical protein ACI4SW_05475, partial [Thermoguttaceae bacterium]
YAGRERALFFPCGYELRFYLASQGLCMQKIIMKQQFFLYFLFYFFRTIHFPLDLKKRSLI